MIYKKHERLIAITGVLSSILIYIWICYMKFIFYIKSIKMKFIVKYIEKNKNLHTLFLWLLLLKFLLKRGKSLKLLLIFLYNSFLYYICNIKKDVTISIAWNKVIMPNHMRPIDGFIEIMQDDFYDRLVWYDTVLDIWGYIWESAIRLAKNNKKVVVYEAHPHNYKYLLLNTSNYNNIESYNMAVVWNHDTSITFYGGAFNMSATINRQLGPQEGLTIPSINILDVLKKHPYDAIKIDIEGAEYTCMQSIINSSQEIFENIKAWFIEFHDININNHYLILQDVLKWLEVKKYKIEYYNAIDNYKIDYQTIDQYTTILIYFMKK